MDEHDNVLLHNPHKISIGITIGYWNRPEVYSIMLKQYLPTNMHESKTDSLKQIYF